VIRKLELPLVLNALGQVVEALGEKVSIAGFAQQGDSIAIPLTLPDFANLNNVGLLLGEAEARKDTQIQMIDSSSAVTRIAELLSRSSVAVSSFIAPLQVGELPGGRVHVRPPVMQEVAILPNK
jgi:hypothetical protein